MSAVVDVRDVNMAGFTGARDPVVARTLISSARSVVQKSTSARDGLLRETVEVLSSLRIAVLGQAAPNCVSGTTGTDSRQLPFPQTDEEYWCANEGLTSEHRFHDRLYTLVRHISEAYALNDVDAMCDAIRRLLWVADHIVSEPLQSVYESGLVLGLLNIAISCADRYLIDEGYRLAARSISALEAKRSRRSALGLPPRPDSECWYRVYALMAELKWKGPASDLNRLVTPKALVAGYDRVEQRCLHYIGQTRSNDVTRNQRVLESLGWCRLELIKMAIMWYPELVAPTIARFNSIHHTAFNADPGDFQRGANDDMRSPWYWDLELYKWCVAGPATLDEALMCHQWRLDAIRAQQRDRSSGLDAYLVATESELKALLERGDKQQVA